LGKQEEKKCGNKFKETRKGKQTTHGRLGNPGLEKVTPGKKNELVVMGKLWEEKFVLAAANQAKKQGMGCTTSNRVHKKKTQEKKWGTEGKKKKGGHNKGGESFIQGVGVRGRLCVGPDQKLKLSWVWVQREVPKKQAPK